MSGGNGPGPPGPAASGRRTQGTLRFLWVVLVADAVFALVGSVAGIVELRHGESLDLLDAFALLGIVWLPVLVVAALRAQRLHDEAARAARAGQQRLDAVLEASGEWLWSVDDAGRIDSSNRGVEELLGRAPEDVVGRPGLGLVHPDERPRVAAMLEEVSAARRGWQGWVIRLAHVDGSYRYAACRATPIVEGHDLLGYRGSARDVTEDVERQAIERALRDERREKERAIHRVLTEEGLLRPVYQPVVATVGGEVIGVEALSRFALDPLRPPDAWFADAEQVGLGRLLEVEAIRRAVAGAADLTEGVHLSVNASPATLTDPEFLALLRDPDTRADRLVVEITEHAVVDDYELLARAIDDIRRAGARLAIDDAGAGYASLRHILRLRPDIVKLDRSLTADVDRDPARRALAIAIVAFGWEIGATVVAEGVERHEELDELAAIGVAAAQGYLTGRPGPLAAALRRA